MMLTKSRAWPAGDLAIARFTPVICQGPGWEQQHERAGGVRVQRAESAHTQDGICMQLVRNWRAHMVARLHCHAYSVKQAVGVGHGVESCMRMQSCMYMWHCCAGTYLGVLERAFAVCANVPCCRAHQVRRLGQRLPQQCCDTDALLVCVAADGAVCDGAGDATGLVIKVDSVKIEVFHYSTHTCC